MTDTKVCTKCGETKPLTAFGTRKGKYRKPGDRHAECKACTNKRLRARYHSDPAVRAAYLALCKKSTQALRKRVINHYGGRCACCGEETFEFLTIDHKYNDGAEHRREIGEGSIALYRAIKREGFPERYQVLCYNCNCAKGHQGTCPHERQRQLMLDTPIFSKEA